MKHLLFSAAVLASSLLVGCNRAATTGTNPAQAVASPETVVATYNDKKITLGELDATIAKDIYELRRQTLDSMILRPLIEAEAKKAGKQEQEFLQGVVEKSVTEPKEEEIKKIYEENKEALGGRSFDEVKTMIVARQKQQQQQQAFMTYVEELKKQAKVHVTLPQPRAQVAAVGPSKGPADAKVTIVEFSDFACPFCSKAKKIADQVMSAYAGKARLVFRNYPLPMHATAPKAAEAALCADEQGKFWEMHDWMFDNQSKLELDSLKEGAKGLGIDAAKFNSCLDSGKFATNVQESVKAGGQVGVTGTPAFFINGRMLSGAVPFEKFKEIIDEELAR